MRYAIPILALLGAFGSAHAQQPEARPSGPVGRYMLFQGEYEFVDTIKGETGRAKGPPQTGHRDGPNIRVFLCTG